MCLVYVLCLCTGACTCTCTCACVCVCAQCLDVCVHVYQFYACVRGCVRVQVYVLGVCVCVCTWSVYVCAHVYLSVHVCVDVYLYKCMRLVYVLCVCYVSVP